MTLRGLPAAAALLLAAATGLGQEASPPTGGSALEELDRAARSVVERCGPAVVRVDVRRPVNLRVVVDDPVARRDMEEALRRFDARESVSAAGFLVDGAGLVLTASAAVGGTATSIRVTFPGQGEREGTLVGEDTLSGVALVRVEPVEGVEPLSLAELPARAGALTLLLAPSSGGPTLSLGFVTEPRRAFGAYDAWLVSSVPVGPGHAGAPLLDARGDVLGISLAARRTLSFESPVLPGPLAPAATNLQEQVLRRRLVERASPVSTFVPADEIRRIVADLLERGRVRRGMAGVRIGRDAPVVSGVLEGGPADEAGVLEGDRVLAVDGVPIGSGTEFGGFIGRRAPGTKVRLRLHAPDGKERETVLVLGELPVPPRTPRLFNGLGVVGSEEAPDLSAAAFSTVAVEGARWVMVASVDPGSPAERAGLRPGDWVVEIEGEPILSEEDYVRVATTVAAASPEVRVRIYRPGEREQRELTLK